MHVNDNYYAKVRSRHESSSVSHVHYYTGGSSKEYRNVSIRRNLYAIVVLLLGTALLSIVVLSSMGTSDTSQLREHRLLEYAKALEDRKKVGISVNSTAHVTETPATAATKRSVDSTQSTASSTVQEHSKIDYRYSLPYDSRRPLRKLRPSQSISLYTDASSPKKFTDLHFIHVPKCGGTSMTSILRKIECSMDPVANVDCCTNPGFCDWHALRRCNAIKGCTNHFAQRQYIMKPHIPSITVLREPSSRLLSAFFYRGHSPNNDFFQVRPYFKDVRDGKLPKVLFPEYVEMPEYQNIQVRMFGADSFPYKNISITPQIFGKAVEALDRVFFVGLQEAYEVSVRLLLREANMTHIRLPIDKERDMSTAALVRQKASLRSNESLMQRVRDLNSWDTDFYTIGRQKFCDTLRRHADLLAEAEAKSADICNFR